MNAECVVCGKSLSGCESLLDHLVQRSTRMMDSSHAFYGERVRDGNYKDPCFCGGEIVMSGSYPDHWAAECQRCGYIWAED